MKTVLCACMVLVSFGVMAQALPAKNVFIITTDGLRWQEVFEGADSLLLHNPRFVKDTALAKTLYWEPTACERRKKLMPFLWSVLARRGQLYGNRTKGSKVSVKNIYKISYPGYNELLTGYADPLPILNKPQYNRNHSILEALHDLPAYHNKVAAFTSWEVFPFILNNRRNTMLHNSGYAALNDSAEGIRVVGEVQERLETKYKTRYDALTFFTAKEYIRQHHPRVVFLGLGETDEFAHKGQYDMYLQQISQVDRMIAELWYYVQTDPFYRNTTTFLISTDHGRGRQEAWVRHHTLVRGSGEIWLALLGQGIAPAGEMQDAGTIYQNQVAATVAALLGENVQQNHRTGKPVKLPLPDTRLAAQTPFAAAGDAHPEK